MRIVTELPKIKDINNNDIFEIINHYYLGIVNGHQSTTETIQFLV